MTKKGKLTVISGFSGSGKGTIVERLVKDHGYVVSISATTRSPRPYETDGVHYFFLSKDDFEKRIEEDKFLEYAKFVDNYYGTPSDYVDSMLLEGKDVILEIEVNGALQVKKKRPDSLLIFMVPPSAEQLKERLTGRGTETSDIINKRLSTAAKETKYINEYDCIVVNNVIDECVQNINSIIAAGKNEINFNNDLYNSIVNDYKRFENEKGDM